MKQLLCLCIALFFLVSCAPKVKVPVISSTTKRPVSVEAKKKVKKNKKRGTQRPYKIKGKTYYPLPSSEGFVQTGIASWYGKPFHGRKTSNGETYNMYKRSGAHKTLPMHTNLVVTNLDNGKEITLRINDRGPFVSGRIIDLSYEAAKELDVVKQGTARVRIAALGEAISVRKGDREVPQFLPHQDFNKGDFYIQIGSFTQKQNATRLEAKMEGQGYKVAISTFTKKGTLFHRVRIQAGHDLRKATKLVKKFQSEGHSGAFVAAR